jgi:hypothetical protein
MGKAQGKGGTRWKGEETKYPDFSQFFDTGPGEK